MGSINRLGCTKHTRKVCKSLLVFFQHPAWFTEQINLKNMWYIASYCLNKISSELLSFPTPNQRCTFISMYQACNDVIVSVAFTNITELLFYNALEFRIQLVNG